MDQGHFLWAVTFSKNQVQSNLTWKAICLAVFRPKPRPLRRMNVTLLAQSTKRSIGQADITSAGSQGKLLQMVKCVYIYIYIYLAYFEFKGCSSAGLLLLSHFFTANAAANMMQSTFTHL